MWSLFPHNCCVPWGFCKWTDTIEAGCFWCQRQRKRRGILTLLLAVYLYLIHDLVWRWKMVSVSVCYLFYQPMDEKIKTWPLRFPTKENPNMEKALFDWPIMLQYDIKAKYRLISRKFSGIEFFHPSIHLANQKAMHICIRSINC